VKALLLHPDRDFEPLGSLEAPEASLRQDLEQDLALGTLLEAMAAGDAHVREVAREVLLASRASDIDMVLHRQAVLKDCLANPGTVRRMYGIASEALTRKRKQWLGIFGRSPGLVLSGADHMLQMFVELLEELRDLAAENAPRFESHGFGLLFATLRQELSDDYLAEVREELERLKFNDGFLMSAEVGPGGNGGVGHMLRKPNDPPAGWLRRLIGARPHGLVFRLAPRDDAGARILSDLRDRALNLAANALGQASDHVQSFFEMLYAELAFYVGCLNLHSRLGALGVPLSFPRPEATGEPRLRARGLREPCLALQSGHRVVPNDVDADGKDLLIITGANQGGKSCFLRALGISQLMMQAGMFVAAESYAAEVRRGLFTHYKREEDTRMESGKFDEELVRMSAIADAARPGDLVLFNESFASTNEREGSEIASQIVRALVERRIKVFFVTHQYSFAHGLARSARDDVLFLRAERRDDGTRTFRLLEGEPLETSYGEDLYREVFVSDA